MYNESRFMLQAMNQESNWDSITNPDGLVSFVQESLAGKRPHFWLSEKPKKEKHSTKVVGDSFKAHIFDTKRDSLVLVYHPVAHKNRGLKEKFEAFAKTVNPE